MQIEVKAPAKVNLFLDIQGKRADGYHSIRSLLLPVSLFDKVVVTTQETDIETIMESSIKLNGIPWPISMASTEDNLTTRAARLLKATTGYPKGARIFLEKKVPVAGGLGGGSSDAAAALKGLNTIWKTGLSLEALMKLGSRLGSDIPAMVHGGVICMQGRGERITPVVIHPERPLYMVLVNPGFGVSTADIYSRYTQDLTAAASEDRFNHILSGLDKGHLETVTDGLFNSLQETVFRKYPLLEMIKNKLEQVDSVGVLLSGTGSTVLGLVRDMDHGLDVEARVRKALGCPVWTSVVSSEIGSQRSEFSKT